MRRRALAAFALLAAVAGCGSSSSDKHPPLIVSAASSLTKAFGDYAKQFKPATVRLSFGGSDELAAQIEAGGKADVFAAANTKLPDQLYSDGKVGRPVKFTANRLVLAVPKGRSGVNSLDDLVKPNTKVAIGDPAVPIGIYTRKVLGGLPAQQADRILTNVKTEEPDVAGIIGKLTQGAVDAGFVYVTDVRAAGNQLRAIELPAKLEPTVTYEAAVVKGSEHPDQAKAFIDGLVKGAGQSALRQAGFQPLP